MLLGIIVQSLICILCVIFCLWLVRKKINKIVLDILFVPLIIIPCHTLSMGITGELFTKLFLGVALILLVISTALFHIFIRKT